MQLSVNMIYQPSLESFANDSVVVFSYELVK